MRTVLKQNGFLLGAVLLLLASSCQESDSTDLLPKPPDNTPPLESVEYTDLTGKEIKRGDVLRLDLNKDGIRDFSFGTQLVGDPLMKVDKVQYCVVSGEESYLPINEEETMARFNKGEVIPLEDFGGFFWNRISFNVLVQKIISETQPPYWEGNWKASHHHFLPVQVYKDQKRYAGWIEISVDTVAEKLIFHKAAVSKNPDQALKAGS